jgi:hypothetical protein
MIRVPANGPAPPLKWWGNAFVRVWSDRTQRVIVLRLPWWRNDVYLAANDYFGRGQLMLSWREGEGWRKGWRAA